MAEAISADRTRDDASEPSWPGPAYTRVIFLLDTAGALEERMLRRWVDRHRPENLHPRAVDTITLLSSRRPGRVRGVGGAQPSGLAALETALSTGDDPILAPLRIAWLPPERDGRRAVRAVDLLRNGDPRDPSRLRAHYIARVHPDRCRIVAAEPAPASELRQRWRSSAGRDVAETVGLPRFVARQATLALDRAERRLRGARYKVPRLIHEDILERPAFHGGVAKLARELGRDSPSVQRQAARNLREIAASHSPLMIDLFAQLLTSSMRGYETLRTDPVQIEQIRLLAQQHPLVFLPTHKSNLDHGVLRRVLHESHLPPNHTAGGDNMNFFPAGPVARRSGIFFIRRSFKDDEIYKFVLRSYIDFLIEKRFPLEWYIEGGRSRSGKLLPPRYGLLAYVVDSYRRGKSDDVVLVPVSIAYDQISDVADYAAEQRGAPKQREGFRWLVRYLRRLGRQYGSIDLRFGEPLSLRKAIGSPGSEADARVDAPDLAVQKLAFEVCARINRATPITPISLAMLTLLGSDRAMSVAEIQRSLAGLVDYAARRGLPTTEPVVCEGPGELERLLDPLVANGVLTRFDGGRETIYSIGRAQHLAAAYYRNTIIHFLTNGAMAELALLGAAEQPECRTAFWDELMRIRDLLKFDFFFADKELFQGEIRRELALHASDWEQQLDEPEQVRRLLDRIRPLHAHRVLRPFLEAYLVVAERLASLAEEPVDDEAQLLDECLAWGEQYALQRRIYSSESVSRTLLGNGLRLARNRGLLEGEPAGLADLAAPAGKTGLAASRLAFADELREIIRRVDVVDALASARRAEESVRPSERREPWLREES